MPQHHQLRNSFILLVIAISLCTFVENQFTSKHSFQVQANEITTTPTPNATTTPTPNATTTPTPAPLENTINNNNQRIIKGKNRNLLLIPNGQGWIATKESQIYALRFVDNGNLTIFYNSIPGKGKIIQNLKYKWYEDNKKIDIFLTKEKIIQTIYEVRKEPISANTRVKEDFLHIELTGLKPGNTRPGQITEKALKFKRGTIIF